MYYLLLVYALLGASAQAQRGLKAIKAELIDLGIKTEIVDRLGLAEWSFTFGSSQCSDMKTLMGVADKQIEGVKEPIVNQATLKYYIGPHLTATYNITDSPGRIPDSPGFNPHRNLIIFIHGFIDGPTLASFPAIWSALSSKGEYNMLTLDASPHNRWVYLRSSTDVRFIGEKLGEVLAAMVKYGVNPSDIHLIGHSLGAHIAGFAGKKFTNLTGLHVGRISGLDPAGPCFADVEDDLKLKATDADFVDVMHTDGGVLGLKEPLGHVDYFPYNGLEQPFCLTHTCSHLHAVDYYAESIVNPDAFPAVRCKDWDAFRKGQCESDISYMGYPSKPGTQGLYFLQTGGKAPYGLGMKGTKYDDGKWLEIILETSKNMQG